MCVDISHFVLEAFRNTDNQVVDYSLDGTESSDVLASSVMQLDVHHVAARVGEADREVGHVFDKLACRAIRPATMGYFVCLVYLEDPPR